ncbi:hypothetical protein OESDEN_15923 [Oesophagostomum dentatum]|uniref:Peptidase S8/S53 domain-containing protein n=1 Tax=Oesophagostomum dentatum TaxID=61180 RepID=A0A0B1SMB6_OESDE|nr:hypothetical protein OESDEN_15923 [Oesophagostomum dentatum]
MWTISINSAINNGENAHYDESCSSTLASTFSNGGRNPETGVATTDLYGRCTRSHSGTSAAAPEAAGGFALALQANPMLTWRDLQHLTVLTSSRNSLFDGRCRDLPDLGLEDEDKHRRPKSNCTHFEWQMNGVGLEYNHLCTRSHSGTSAAAPEAAGVFALALEANPMLTWRDLQHLTVLTSSRNSLFDGRCRDLPDLGLEDEDKHRRPKSNCTHFEWQMNGVGLEYNHLFGFGVLDAAEMVMLAMVWKTAPPRYHCTAGTIDTPQ